MAKGVQLKQDIINKILKMFEGSFLYNNGKEIRIVGQEDGEEIQIKVTLTCAKTNVRSGDEDAIPNSNFIITDNLKEETVVKNIEITEEEKNNVASLLASLGL